MYKCLYTHTANAAFLSASLRYSSTMINDFLLQNIIIKNTILPSPHPPLRYPHFTAICYLQLEHNSLKEA